MCAPPRRPASPTLLAAAATVYSTCLFCHQPLGRNEVIEAFPVGRRLAYDMARGRLWVVCGKCERWNLTPLDARWEAIEAAERHFRETRLRVSTDQIGLARLREGLELVRIGQPLRPEMAAWRYGDQFGRRWKRHVAVSAALAVGVGGVVVAGPVLGLVSMSAVSPLLNMVNMVNLVAHSKRGTSVHIPGHPQPLVVRPAHVAKLRLTSDRDGGFRLHVEGVRRDAPKWRGAKSIERAGAHDLAGDDAVRVAAAILPRLNRNGASRRVVGDAASLLEAARSPTETFALIAEADRRRARGAFASGEPGALRSLPTAARLALEMAAHEEGERRALEGELAELERAWQAAEEIAAIADDLGLPSGVHGALARLKGARG